MCSVYDDVELLDWLRWAKGDGPSFLRTKAEATFTADLNDYNLLRPLLELKREWPKPTRGTLCASATDSRGESWLLKSTSPASIRAIKFDEFRATSNELKKATIWTRL